MRTSRGPRCAKSSFSVQAKLFNQTIDFLVDTGADVSLLPAKFKKYAFPFDVQLEAANKSNIKTFGCVATNLILPSLRRSFHMSFVVADVNFAILGADFFKDNNLLIDVSHKLILDNTTKLSVNLSLVSCDVPSINASVISPNSELLKILSENENVFNIHAPRPTPTTQFSIINSEVPKPSKPYRLSPDKIEAAKEEIRKEIELGRMQRSSSQYASPFFPVKKPDGTWRFVADFTKLNNVTQKDNYIPPVIDDLIARIPTNCVFTKLDLNKAFYQIPLNENDRHKTAVTTPFGLYEFLVMPMGLKNASQTLQRYMDSVLADSNNTIVYCDDILLFTPVESHLQELDLLLRKLHSAGLVVNRAKSQFMCCEINFLGHNIRQDGILPSNVKIQAIIDYAVPTKLRQLRRFIGMANFLRKFIPNLSHMANPLFHLTKKDVKYVWNDECQQAFDDIKAAIQNATLLRFPTCDDAYILTTDASNVAVGASLRVKMAPLHFSLNH